MPEKLTEFPLLHDILSKNAWILRYVCPKNIFPGLFRGGGNSLPPVSYAHSWAPCLPPTKSGPALSGIAILGAKPPKTVKGAWPD